MAHGLRFALPIVFFLKATRDKEFYATIFKRPRSTNIHSMKTIQVYDPSMCCSTGICGTSVDPDLVSFAAMLAQLGQHGIQIERYNLGKQPLAFVQNATVKGLLETDGAEVLPVIFWDGEVHLKGRYPTKDERPDWIRAAHGNLEVAS